MEREYNEMAEQSKRRRYHSPGRAEGAQATANQILAAAEQLFARDGYAPVTMKEIARTAGVAPATVYLHFASKVAIVHALADAVTGSSDLSVENVERAASVEAQVQVGAAVLRHLNERSWVVSEILRSQAGADPELTALAEEWRRRHLDAVQRGVAPVAGAGRLRQPLDAAEAADILYAVGGTDVFRALVKERGWSPAAYESWLADFMAEYLVAPVQA